MKHFLLGIVIALGCQIPAGAQDSAGLGAIKTIYVMPMSNGLDQYLAVRLAANGTPRVVTDPVNADAVFTDHIGASFEEKLATLTAPKPAPTDQQSGQETQQFARIGGGTRGRGNTFLVDRKTGTVLWSVYERPKGNRPDNVRKTADRIANKFAESIGGKAPKN